MDSPSMGGRKIAATIDRFKNAGATNEYIERQFYCHTENKPPQASQFWVDLIANVYDWISNAQSRAPMLLSSNFIHSCKSVVECVLVISILDLPFKKETPLTTTNQNNLTFEARSNCMIFVKFLKDFSGQNLDLEILLSQKYVDPLDRYLFDETLNTQTLQNVTEFVKGKVYCSRVAITNSSEIGYTLNLITEVPQGAIPVNVLDYSKSHVVRVNPLTAAVLEYYFYFPQEGQFTAFLSSATFNGNLVATATGVAGFRVNASLQEKNVKSIQSILKTGSNADILEFLRTKNIFNPEVFSLGHLNGILHLMKDKNFFTQCCKIFDDRAYYQPEWMNFAFYHCDKSMFDLMRRYLSTRVGQSCSYR